MAPKSNSKATDVQEGVNLEALRLKFSSTLADAPARSMSRKAWGIDLNTVWVPFFTAHKAIGTPGIQGLSDEALGAPIILGRDKAGNVRFSPTTGRLSYRVHPDVARQVKGQMDGYVRMLQEQTSAIIHEAPKVVAAQVVRQQAAGQGILEQDAYDAMLFEEEQAKAQAAKEQALPEPVAVPEPELQTAA